MAKPVLRQFISEQMGSSSWVDANPDADGKRLQKKARDVRRTKGLRVRIHK